MIREFINWQLSPDGQYFVEDNGFIPVGQVSETEPQVYTPPTPPTTTPPTTTAPPTSSTPGTSTTPSDILGTTVSFGLPIALSIAICAVGLTIFIIVFRKRK